MTRHDVLVIGGGPGGYVAAIRAAQLGKNVGLVEKESLLGGTCLRIGCIPSKALLESTQLFVDAKHHFAENGVFCTGVRHDLPAMMKRKNEIVAGLGQGVGSLLKKWKISRYSGLGTFAGPNKVMIQSGGETTAVEAESVIIATGSKSANLPGVQLHTDRIGTSTEALSYSEVPKKMIVIGAGAIGLELGSVWSRLGAQVIVLEYLDRILPECDGEIASMMKRILEKQGIEFRLKSRVTGAKFDGRQCVVTLDGGETIDADRVLISVGRISNTEGLGLENIGIETDRRGRIPVDAHLRTVMPNIFAIGDVVDGPMLAHKAEEEGVAAAEFIATGYGHVNYDVIPSVVYTHPEVASVGKTEEQLTKEGVSFQKGSFPFKANARARITGDLDGVVKVLADANTDRVLGVHILSNRAGDLIAECAAAMEFGASSEDLARVCHAHPTLPEVVKEAAMAVSKRSVHF